MEAGRVKVGARWGERLDGGGLSREVRGVCATGCVVLDVKGAEVGSEIRL